MSRVIPLLQFFASCGGQTSAFTCAEELKVLKDEIYDMFNTV
jgi:hypothetical protein